MLFPQHVPKLLIVASALIVSSCAWSVDGQPTTESTTPVTFEVANGGGTDTTAPRVGAGSADAGAGGTDQDDGRVDGGEPEGPTALDEDAMPCVDGHLVVAGHPAVEPILRRAGELYLGRCPRASFVIDASNDGLDLVCGGRADIAGVTSAPSDQQPSCDDGTEILTIPIAFEAVAVVTAPDQRAVDCLSFVDLYSLVGPGAEDVESWSDGDERAISWGSSTPPFPPGALSPAGPGRRSVLFDQFVDLVMADAATTVGADVGIRSDFEGSPAPHEVVVAVGRSDTGLGWMPYSLAAGNADAVRVVALARRPGDDCVEPTPATISDGSYPAARTLSLHIARRSRATSDQIGPFVDFLLGDGYRRAVTESFGSIGQVELSAEQLRGAIELWNRR